MNQLLVSRQAVAFPVVDWFLNDLQNRVDRSINHAIEEAQQAGISLEVEAGRQISLAIENARVAYEKALNDTIDKVDTLTRKRLDEIKAMTERLEGRIANDIQTLCSEADLLIESLPVVGSQPKIKKINPQYVVVGNSNQNATIKIAGIFKWAATKGYEPSLVFGNQEFFPVQNTDLQLIFSVPAHVIIPENAQDPLVRNSYGQGKLKVQWDDGIIWWHKRVSTYNLRLGALPLSPGQISAYLTHRVEKTQTQHHQSSNLDVNGNDHYDEGNMIPFMVTQPFFPSPGFSIDTDTISLNIHPGARGFHQEQITYRGKDRVDVTVAVRRNHGHDLGIVGLHVEFNESKQVDVDSEPREERIDDLTWGTSRVVVVGQDERLSKIVFRRFDGVNVEFAGTDNRDKYVTVESQNGNLVIRANNLDGIDS